MQYQIGDWLYYTEGRPNSGVYLRQIVNLYDDSFTSENGFSNQLRFYRKAEPHEIPDYIQPEPEDYKYLVKLLKKLKIK